MVSNLPLSSSVSGHLLSTGSPDPRQLPFGPGIRPYPTSYAQTTRRRMPVLRPAVSCCLSAIGIGLLGHPAPAGELNLPHGRPTGPQKLAGPQRGCRVAHEQAATGQGASFIPGTVVRSRPATILRPAPAALLRPVPTAPLKQPIDGGHFHETSSKVHRIHPSPRGNWQPPRSRKTNQPPAGLLLARGPRMEQRPLRLLPRAPHPAVTRDARQGGDRPSRTGPGTTPPASAGPPTAPPT